MSLFKGLKHYFKKLEEAKDSPDFIYKGVAFFRGYLGQCGLAFEKIDLQIISTQIRVVAEHKNDRRKMQLAERIVRIPSEFKAFEEFVSGKEHEFLREVPSDDQRASFIEEVRTKVDYLEKELKLESEELWKIMKGIKSSIEAVEKKIAQAR